MGNSPESGTIMSLKLELITNSMSFFMSGLEEDKWVVERDLHDSEQIEPAADGAELPLSVLNLRASKIDVVDIQGGWHS